MSSRVPDDQGPDTPINMAATTADEELPFAGSTPDAPSIAEPGAPQDFDALADPIDHADLDARTPEQVLDDHLRLSRTGTADDDLARNFSPDLVVLTADGVHRGHAGMRDLAARLRRELRGMEFTYKATVVSGHMAFLEWSATARNGARVDDGTDSYWIEGGRIVAQTIHYTVMPPQS